MGSGGAVASETPAATQAGLQVLREGGTAADAAVAVASTLGVTDPFVAGIGGGGYFVYYDAATHRVYTIDGRETAPAADGQNLFIDPQTGKPLPFPTAVTSGLSVGVPGTLMTWQQALSHFGHFSLAFDLAPAERVARRGFPVERHTARGGSRERLPLRRLQLHARPVPTGRPATGGRLDHAQPGAGADLRADRPARCRRLLRWRDRRGRRTDRASPATGAGDGARAATRRDDARGPAALPRAAPRPHARPLPRLRRVLDGAVLERGDDGRRVTEHPLRTSTWRARPACRRYITSSSRRGWRSRIATGGSAIPRT